MSQPMNQVTNTTSPAEAPIKRKRGRPRKDESQSSPRPSVPSLQREGSGASKLTANIQSKGKDSIEDVDDDDDDYINDEMVGQAVTGVLEYAFEAGYFLSVKVGDSNVPMKGVVFKEGCVVPVTPENDIAPHLKMYKRGDFPISALKVSSQVPPVQTAGTSSLNPTENNGNQNQQQQEEQQKLASESITMKQDHSLLQKLQSGDKEQHAKLSDDKILQDKLSDDKEQQENEKLSAEMEGLKDLSEKKTDQITAGLSGREQTIQGNAVTDDDPEYVKSDEAVNDTVMLKEAVIVPPETVCSVKDSSVVVPAVVEQEKSGTFGFQISMENEDNEDESSEPPGELVSTMETEKREEGFEGEL